MLSNVPTIQNLDKKFLSYIKKIPPENVCCIIYTSGTAGTPKGVMLTHKSIQANIMAASELLDEGNSLNDARFLSLLPLSHSYEHTVGLHLPLSIGANVWFCSNPERFAQDLQGSATHYYDSSP